MESVINILENCRLCARSCGADRIHGEAGRCGGTDKVFAARSALHMWEEPCISGREGSGAVFFSGCPLGCVFCQNRSIALGKTGKEISLPRLAQIFLELQEQKANNINLVTPTHYVPQIISAVENARRMGLVIPVVYNTASYERPETVRMLMGTVDIFLPDLKYYDTALSAKYSYISGQCEFDARGMLRKGTVVRHMILPGHTRDSKQILRYLHETYGDDIYISIMNQYTPMPGIGERYPELGRRITRREYDKVVDFALQIGITNAFVQEGETAKESFIPEFDGTGL